MPRRLQPRAATPLDIAADEARRTKIREAWAETAGLSRQKRDKATADALGISVRTLYREIARLGVEL
jgi:DNA-binding NtrC family response regulator